MKGYIFNKWKIFSLRSLYAPLVEVSCSFSHISICTKGDK
jgi:hypothetical protein